MAHAPQPPVVDQKTIDEATTQWSYFTKAAFVGTAIVVAILLAMFFTLV